LLVNKVAHTNNAQPKIALWTPLPPLGSGISDYSAGLIRGFLSQLADITVYSAESADPVLPVPVFPYSHYTRHPEHYDVHIYQMGNTVDFHAEIYEQALREPGILILHDLSLSGFYSMYYKDDPERFYREVLYDVGPDFNIPVEKLFSDPVAMSQLPMLRRIVEASRLILVHSHHGQRELVTRYPTSLVQVIPQWTKVTTNIDIENEDTLRQAHGYTPEQFIFGVFGAITPAKRVVEIIQVFEAVHRKHDSARLLIVGRAQREDYLIYRIHRLAMLFSW
jgi:glycosyltransferase involved in cell wall biosynthesis